MLFQLLAAATAAAQVPLPEYRPGDAFIFTGGRVERVRHVQGAALSSSARGRASWIRSRNPVVPILGWRFADGEGRRTIGGDPGGLWPLRDGGSVRFRMVTEFVREKKRLRAVALWSCRTGASAPVSVPAGTFDALPIVCERYSPTTMRLAERIRFDWAPEVGHYVRRQSTLYASGEKSDYRLVAALTGESATEARISALAEHGKDK